MKVCRPLKPAMPLHVKRTTLILAIVISFLGALPLPYIYGSVPFHSITYGSIGRRCGKVKGGHRLVRAIYAIVIGVFAVALVTALIVLYSKIGCTVYRKLKMNRSKSSEVEFKNSVSKTDEDGVAGSEYSDGTQNTLDSKISNSNIIKIDTNCKEQQLENKQQTTTSQPVGSTKRRKDNRRITHKLTVSGEQDTFKNKMLAARVLRSTVSCVAPHVRRNISSCSVLAQKQTSSGDPNDLIQQLFIQKIREFDKKTKSAGGKMPDVDPSVQANLDKEMKKVATQFGVAEGKEAEFSKFPAFNFQAEELQVFTEERGDITRMLVEQCLAPEESELEKNEEDPNIPYFDRYV
ncbi:ATP5J [Mytilus edulis]|uniref:ATPeF0F6 n=2 Tax=Mytilus edulis TaxID=6550 RepID=A0A8S3R897_MYTED|nr:ATP5J [Mytilus edulis]